jgi:hypothetical protein
VVLAKKLKENTQKTTQKRRKYNKKSIFLLKNRKKKQAKKSKKKQKKKRTPVCAVFGGKKMRSRGDRFPGLFRRSATVERGVAVAGWQLYHSTEEVGAVILVPVRTWQWQYW